MLRFESGLEGSRKAARSAAERPLGAAATGRTESGAFCGVVVSVGAVAVVEHAANRQTAEERRVSAIFFDMMNSIWNEVCAESRRFEQDFIHRPWAWTIHC